MSGLARPFFHKVKWAMALMTSTGDIFRLSFKTEAPAADCFGYVSNIGCPPKSWCPFGLFSRPNPTQDEEKNHQISSKSWECVRVSNTLFHKVKWAMALMTSTGDIFRLSFKTEVPPADCFGYVSNIGCPPNKAAKPDFIKPRPGRPPRLASHLRHIGPAASPSRMDLHAVYQTSTGQMDIPRGQMDSLCCASFAP